MASRPVRCRLSVILLAALPLLGGCAIDESDLARWPEVAQGDARLAAYLADDTRPYPLRAQAAGHLLRMGELDHLMGVVKTAEGVQRTAIIDMYATMISNVLTKMHTPEEQANAAGLAYYLLQHTDALTGAAPDGEPKDARFVDVVLDWCLPELEKPEDERAKPPRRVDDIVLAALAARPQVAGPRVLDRMRAAANTSDLLGMNRILTQVEDPEVRRGQATHLLGYARKVHPEVPPEVAAAMVQNRNPTLLHYLLDAARDPRVPRRTREAGLIAAGRLLKADALGGLVLLLRADDPANDNVFRLNALDYAWDIGGAARLADALQALPPTGTWWPEGVQFRAYVDSFCDQKLGPAKDDVRPVLERLVDDPNWVTRAYAMRCVERLYPDDAAALLAPLAEDETPLPGFSAEGPTTIGAHARAVIEAARAQ